MNAPMRCFIDFWVKGVEVDQFSEILEALKRLGFSGAAIEVEEGLKQDFEELRSRASELGLAIYRKLVLKPRGRGDLLRSLRENRGKFEVITVLCENLEVALVAARDSRVDTLIIPPKPRFRFDKGVAALIRNKVELPFSYFLDNKLAFLETALDIVEILGRKIELIVSSGASGVLGLRGPRELASLLQVLGVDLERALDSVSKIPEKLLKENLLKLSKRYVSRGVIKLD